MGGAATTVSGQPAATAEAPFFHKGRARARCPHCQAAANCRSSRAIAITNRELYYECPTCSAVMPGSRARSTTTACAPALSLTPRSS